MEHETSPIRVQMRQGLYWFLVIIAHKLLDENGGFSLVSFLPLFLRRRIGVYLVRLSSFILGKTTDLEIRIHTLDLSSAISADDELTVQYLMISHPNLANTPWLGLTPLERAISEDSLKSAKTLLKYSNNASLALRHCKSMSALDLLIKNGADPKFVDPEGRRCVDVAARSGLLEIAETMMRAGALYSASCMNSLRSRGDYLVVARLESLRREILLEKKIFLSLVLRRVSPQIYALRDIIFMYCIE